MRDLGKGEAERGVGMKNDPSSRFLLDSICNRYVRLASEWGLNYFLLTLGDGLLQIAGDFELPEKL